MTGFVRDTVDEAVEAVAHMAREIDPNRCRARVAELFSAEANVARHEALYLALTGAKAEPPSIAPGPPAVAPRLTTAVATAPAT